MQTSAKTQRPHRGADLTVTAAQAADPAAGGNATRRFIKLHRHRLLETRREHGVEQRLVASALDAARCLVVDRHVRCLGQHPDSAVDRARAAYAAALTAGKIGAGRGANGEEA